MHAIFEDYLDLLDQADSAQKTFTNNRRSFELFDEFLTAEQIEAEAVRLADLKRWLKLLLGQYQPSTVARHAISVRAAYKHAHELGFIEANPTAGLQKLIPRIVEKLPEVLTASNLRAMHKEIETPRQEMIFHMHLWTGCRSAELRPLRWQPWEGSYVDFDNDQLVILGKGQKLRFVPLHPILSNKLRSYAAEHRTNVCVIESQKRSPLHHKTWNAEIKALLDGAGLQFEKKSHLFRKTLNTNLQRQGVPEQVLDALFGWAPTTIRTKHYSGVATDEVRAAVLKAYADEPVVPEQNGLNPYDGLIDHLQAEIDRLRALKLELRDQ